MGMYTEIVFKARITKNINHVAMQVFEVLFNPECEKIPVTLPDHAFFKCSRWRMIGSSGSFYHHPFGVSSWYDAGHSEDIYIFSRSDFKNYSSEIELFFDWCRPYLEALDGECIGWYWYEEEEAPTLIYK